MSEAQRNALSQVKKILAEHFNCSVTIVEYDTGLDDSGKDCVSYQLVHFGGYAAAIGLCEIGKDFLKDPDQDSREMGF